MLVSLFKQFDYTGVRNRSVSITSKCDIYLAAVRLIDAKYIYFLNVPYISLMNEGHLLNLLYFVLLCVTAFFHCFCVMLYDRKYGCSFDCVVEK